MYFTCFICKDLFLSIKKNLDKKNLFLFYVMINPGFSHGSWNSCCRHFFEVFFSTIYLAKTKPKDKKKSCLLYNKKIINKIIATLICKIKINKLIQILNTYSY